VSFVYLLYQIEFFLKVESKMSAASNNPAPYLASDVLEFGNRQLGLRVTVNNWGIR
jgi:hypothetical protein